MTKYIPQSMLDMIDYLNKCTKAYDEGNPIITDAQWDKLYFDLEAFEKRIGVAAPHSPTQSIQYDVVNKLEKVPHNHPMLSLQKTKDISVIMSFVEDQEVICMEKLDGLTCSLRYANGVLVSAETRGNGLVGENILHNMYHVKGVPKRIDFSDDLIVDGEVICTYDDFEPWSNTYKNPRNFASGSVRLLDSKECEKRNLTFIAWDVIKGFENSEYLSDRLQLLRSLNFNIVSYNLINTKQASLVQNIIELIKDYARQDKVPIDGVVFKYDNCNYYNSLGATDHHFRGGIAYKFYDEEYETRLYNIEWSMGRTGILTPIAVFEPVDIDGSIVERASLHNLTILQKTLHGTGWQGQKISVIKSNMIIPQIVNAEEDNGYPNREFFNYIPIHCPVCGGEIIVKTNNDSQFTFCNNPDCSGKLINRLDHFCGKKGLDIRGLSKATLEKLIDWNWISCLKDIYNLSSHRTDWIQKEGFGVKSVDNILTAIESTKITSTFTSFISALGIPLIGTVQAKEIAKKFPGWAEFIDAVDRGFNFSTLSGFGIVKSQNILHFDFTEAKEIAKLLNNIYAISIKEEKEINKSCDGLTFVITGSLNKYKNRAELTSAIEACGGKVVSSISKNTNYLINNDIMSESSKNVAAKKLNIPIISEQEFIIKFIEK